MSLRRAAAWVTIAAVVAVPVLVPCAYDFARFGGAMPWRSASRWAGLAGNTLALIVGVWFVALPIATTLAVILTRTDLRGRRILLGAFAAALFVPLPVIATTWQDAFRSTGPWAAGLVPAVFVHAIAGLPWAVWIIALGLGHVEPEVEDDALTNSPPSTVLRRVTLARARAAIGVAALWLSLGCATEITVTDVMQVRTFAEEVYTQTVLPDPGAPADEMPARAVAVALLPALPTALIVAAFVAAWRRRLPPLGSLPLARPLIYLRWWQGPAVLGVGIALAPLLAVPIGSLVMRLGGTTQGTWSASVAAGYMRLAVLAHGPTVGRTIIAGMSAGAIASAGAVLACWSARRDRGVGVGFVALTAALWALPGPVIGVALAQAIRWLVDLESRAGGGLLAHALYIGPSWVPAAWACLIRFFPCAVALVWPAVRAIPAGQFDVAALDGRGELRHVVWPAAQGAAWRAAWAVAILTIGEIGASKIVATAGGELFAHDVFARMHYGPGNQLAALCLLLLAVVLPPAALAAVFRRR